MEQEEGSSPPFWVQNTTTGSGRLRRSYSMFLNSSAVLIFILVAAFALVLVIAPTLHSFTSHILKPQSVKKSWDSLNLVLVLFAILCGFLSRNNNNTGETPRSYQNQTFTETPQEYLKQNPETSLHWYEYSDRTEYYRPYNRLRSISSYPDLRQDSPWLDAEERWRFYDDTHVNRYRQNRRPEEEEESIVKNIKVDTFEVRTKEVPRAPPVLEEEQQLPPSPPSLPPPRRKDHPRNAEMIEKQRSKDLGAETLKPRNSMPVPPPPPPPPANKSKRGSATKEFLTSFKGKKKRQRQRSVENFESIMLKVEPPTTLLSRQPPPPPPPPPPPSVFHSLFSSKKSKYKKGHYDPRPSPHVSSSKTKPQVANANLKPRLRENFYPLEENVVTGNESPLIPIPPPPPPPPFKLPGWKFKVQGDFVRIDSISSSSSDRSPESDEVEDSQSPTSEAAPNGGDEPEILLFYPSPNVDSKADTFIEKFRAGLRMEKINSTREKQGIGMSNLGPSPYSQKSGSNKLKIHN